MMNCLYWRSFGLWLYLKQQIFGLTQVGDNDILKTSNYCGGEGGVVLRAYLKSDQIYITLLE